MFEGYSFNTLVSKISTIYSKEIPYQSNNHHKEKNNCYYNQTHQLSNRFILVRINFSNFKSIFRAFKSIAMVRNRFK
jgi:hypothetical protein